jgi:hypothetical protein
MHTNIPINTTGTSRPSCSDAESRTQDMKSAGVKRVGAATIHGWHQRKSQ